MDKSGISMFHIYWLLVGQPMLVDVRAPNMEVASLRKIKGGIAAVKTFSGRPEVETMGKKKELTYNYSKMGLLACFNGPRTKSFVMIKRAEREAESEYVAGVCIAR